MTSGLKDVAELQERIWQGSIPLKITLSPVECHSYDDSLPYLIQHPRVSYLPFLLPRLKYFFAPALINPDVRAHEGWFSFEGVPLKWQHPVGLLFDLFSGAEPATPNDKDVSTKPSDDNDGRDTQLPWNLVLHFSDWPSDHLIPLDEQEKIQHDVFINTVKEADFLRNGTAKVMMSLSKEDSTNLWESVKTHDLAMFNSVNQKFLNPPGGLSLRHIPIKIYLPDTPREDLGGEEQTRGSLRVVQSLVTPMSTARDPQTLGTALHSMLPTVFPTRRSYIFAQAVLHGAVVPLNANMQDLMRAAAYPDGFLHIVVAMVN